MLTCPYCPPEDRKPIKNAAGLSMHVRGIHPNKWKGGLEVSLPPGYILGRPTPAVAKKGQKKAPIPMDCPAPKCEYHTDHPPGMARHIKFTHPEIWKGSLAATFGKTPRTPIKRGRGQGRMIDPALLAPEKARELAGRRIYEAKRRKKFKSLGLSATGRPYKRQSPTLTLSRPEVVEAKKANSQRKIEPSVYHAPFEVPVKECPHCKRAFPSGVIWRESE